MMLLFENSLLINFLLLLNQQFLLLIKNEQSFFNILFGILMIMLLHYINFMFWFSIVNNKIYDMFNHLYLFNVYLLYYWYF